MMRFIFFIQKNIAYKYNVLNFILYKKDILHNIHIQFNINYFQIIVYKVILINIYTLFFNNLIIINIL